MPLETAKTSPPPTVLAPDWYKDAIIYEAHVRGFMDSNGDGVGDFRGLTQKLDYLQDLGITAIWLLPFYPSPLRDDGYDIADYTSINPIYGTLRDFKQLLGEAHRRGLRIITELVLNHTSEQHPWFQRARRAPSGSAWRDYYVWSNNPDKYREARIIFQDFELSNWTWDPVAQAYYWHRFYAHQPDLNYNHPPVHKEIFRALDFWLDLGVDGFRLDAVPYLYEREGTSCENLPETHAFLRDLRRHVDAKYGDRVLLAEANQWPEEAVTYLGNGRGDECHMAFHFPLMPRIFMSVRMEDRVPIVDILDQTPAIGETSQWALFLRNHDELTLEMVTDEERDYMYRVYANDTKARINLGIRRRLAPLLGNDRRRIELVHLLLFALPGTPVLYYGDEIGMGDNVFLGDRNGVRTPMQWSSDKNAGFSRAHPHALYLPIILDPEYHFEAVNVEAQQRNPNSLLWWIKHALTLRKRHRAFGRGTLEFISSPNRKILAFVRRYEEETVLVIANLSRFAQAVELDLREFAGRVPVEAFGRTRFPPVVEGPYRLTLSGYAAFWFLMEPAKASDVPLPDSPALQEPPLQASLETILKGQWPPEVEQVLAAYLPECRWFRSKEREIKATRIVDSIPVTNGGSPGQAKWFAWIVAVDFVEGDPEQYVIPFMLAPGSGSGGSQLKPLLRLRLEPTSELWELYEAMGDAHFCRALLDTIARRRVLLGGGEVRGNPLGTLRGLLGPIDPEALNPKLQKGEQSNSTVQYGDILILKLFRRVEAGINPELEMGQFLTERHFPNVPPVAGYLEYEPAEGDPGTLAIVHQFISNARDGWSYSLDLLSRYFDRVRALPLDSLPAVTGSVLQLAHRDPPEPVLAIIGTSLEFFRLLGQRTGELHLALGSSQNLRAFAPEPFTPFYQRSLYQSYRNLTVHNLGMLRRSLETLPEDLRNLAQGVCLREGAILETFRAVHQQPLSGQRIRCHGDFHLGQVLYTGKDFMILDFEREPARSLGERRIKTSPLRDVAGMLRSLDYLLHAGLAHQVEMGTISEAGLPGMSPWVRFWYRWVAAGFLRGYLGSLGKSALIPASSEEVELLLEREVLAKSIYEVGYELRNRPAWLRVPLLGIQQLLERSI